MTDHDALAALLHKHHIGCLEPVDGTPADTSDDAATHANDAAIIIAAGVRVTSGDPTGGDAGLREAAQAYLAAFDMPLTTDPEVHYDTLTAARDSLRAALTGDTPGLRDGDCAYQCPFTEAAHDDCDHEYEPAARTATPEAAPDAGLREALRRAGDPEYEWQAPCPHGFAGEPCEVHRHLWAVGVPCQDGHHGSCPGRDEDGNECGCLCGHFGEVPATPALTPDRYDIPPTVIVCQHGHYWRNYGDALSMCPVSDDNLACSPAATYILDRLAARTPDVEALDVERLARALDNLLPPLPIALDGERVAPSDYADAIAREYAALAPATPCWVTGCGFDGSKPHVHRCATCGCTPSVRPCAHGSCCSTPTQEAPSHG